MFHIIAYLPPPNKVDMKYLLTNCGRPGIVYCHAKRKEGGKVLMRSTVYLIILAICALVTGVLAFRKKKEDQVEDTRTLPRRIFHATIAAGFIFGIGYFYGIIALKM